MFAVLIPVASMMGRTAVAMPNGRAQLLSRARRPMVLGRARTARPTSPLIALVILEATTATPRITTIAARQATLTAADRIITMAEQIVVPTTPRQIRASAARARSRPWSCGTELSAVAGGGRAGRPHGKKA